MSKKSIEKIGMKLKNISFFIAIIITFAAGLAYVLLSDIGFANTASWLFLSILLSFGSGICMTFSENLKEKPVYYYILKGSSILLEIGFLIFLFSFKNTTLFLNVKYENIGIRDLTMVVSIVLSFIALFVQVVNTTSNILFKEK